MGTDSMKAFLKPTLGLAVAALAAHASATVTFYEHDNFGGRAFTSQGPVQNFGNVGFNDRVSSVVVTGEDWEVCEHAGFEGRCMILRPGSYPSLGAMSLNDRLSSARAVNRNYAPTP